MSAVVVTPHLNVTVEPTDDGLLVTVGGVLDLTTCAELVIQLREIDRYRGDVIVDLCGLDTLGGVGVGILARARAQLSRQGRRLVLRGAQAGAAEVVAADYEPVATSMKRSISSSVL